MADHTLTADSHTLHGYFSHQRQPVLTIAPGDTVRTNTLDANWGLENYHAPDNFVRKCHDARANDPLKGHPMVGPIAIEGAKAGQVLEVQIGTITPGAYGYTGSGGGHFPVQDLIGMADEPFHYTLWDIDAAARTAVSNTGYCVKLSPFMGVMGVAPAAAGLHPTPPPRRIGGNMDCKALVSGSVLYLPIEVDGALFSVGDGHAAQGDGEISGTAIECPMDEVELTFNVRDDLQIDTPFARTPEGWITLGFHLMLNQAMYTAISAMLDLMQREYGMSRRDAYALASVVADLRVTQIVNISHGVHMLLPHDALTKA